MEELAKKECVVGSPILRRLDLETWPPLLARLNQGWNVVEPGRLCKTFTFDNFVSALAFVNRIGVVAEASCHHPDLELRWGVVAVTLWTHDVDGLSENDFILAAKIELLER